MSIGLKPKDGWKRVALGDHAEIIFSSVDKKSYAGEKPVRLCNYTDVYYRNRIEHADGLMESSATDLEIKKFSLKKGDVLITKDSESSDDIGVPALVTKDFDNVLCGYHLAIIRPISDGLDGAFLSQVFRSHYMRKQLHREANGVTRFGLGVDTLKKLALLAPSLTAQIKIRDVLFTWDTAIEKLTALITSKTDERRGFMQQFLTAKTRFNEFRNESWRTVRIGSLLEECDRYVNWSDNTAYRFASIRRRSGGLFDRGTFYGREVKTKVLKLIKAGDFLISKRQVVHGAWAMVMKPFDGFGVSDEYDVLVNRDADVLDMRFFNYLSQTRRLLHMAYLASNGVHIEKLIFNFDDFAKEKVKIPPTLAEQKKIADVLSACDREIELLEKQLEALEEQKRGLMQKLLTGEIRVKI
jgi:type I restriction enzyme, S subunit